MNQPATVAPTSIKALLRGLVDYAGLFPPASLSMAAAVAEYAAYRAGDDEWMLGRFVVPAARLDEFESAAAGAMPMQAHLSWALSALIGSDAEEDIERAEAFNRRHADARAGAVLVDTVEIKANSAREVARAAELLDRRFDTYMEVPVAEDPGELIAAIARTKAKAKIRTGGVTRESFPAAAHVVRFIARCIEHGVEFKATAGLHHPWCDDYPLTYASDAPAGPMFGFLNVIVATAALRAGWSAADATRILEERDRHALVIGSDGARWHDRHLNAAALQQSRFSMTAFGSCSFRDPVSGLREEAGVVSIDPKLASWVASANEPTTDFPIQNLPFGVFKRHGEAGAGVGVAIGDRVLNIDACVGLGLLSGSGSRSIARDSSLNRLMSQGNAVAAGLRQDIAGLLEAGNKAAAKHEASILVSQADVEMLLPAHIGDYTDFYASINHAHNVGTMLRPENPLLPNYKYIPVGYHGRASSVVVSGAEIRRPIGQRKGEPAPTVGPSTSMDYELEIGAFVGAGNALGDRVSINDAESHIWGVCLLNDWSARDVQAWEGQPLGPFLSKNFSTSISPWVVTMDALQPFRVPATKRPDGDPAPLPYLTSNDNTRNGGINFTLEVWIRSAAMRTKGIDAMRLSRASFKDMYWTFAQMLTHHTMGGCNLQAGDLLGSGTVSGKQREEMGCLLERTRRGAEPFDLPSGERRGFLEDGDEVIFRGYAERDGYRRIGLGECRGVVTPVI